MRIFLFLLILFPCVAYGQITKPGVQAENGGSVLGRALTINCDNVCIVCNLTGTTMNITFSSSCSSGPPTQYYLAYQGVTMTYLGVKMTYLGR